MTDAPDHVRVTAWLHGHVQGVGMRWWIRSRALELGLVGWARNTDDGRVEVVAEGPREAVQALLALLESGAVVAAHGRPGRVTALTTRESPARGGLAGFAER